MRETGERFISTMLPRRTCTIRLGASMSGLMVRSSPCRLTIRPVTIRPSSVAIDDRLVLVADRLAGEDDRLQQVADAEAAGDAREVGSQASPLVVVAVA